MDRAINCKKCGGMMIFKVTAKQGKELYECQKCDHIIWIK
jgi:DNA-directed RNA polymerase subunit M/transcription elongation factor TFIIS